MSEKLKKLARDIKPKISNEVVDNKLVLTLSGNVGEPYWYDDDPEDFINEKRVKDLVGDSKQDIIIKLNSPGGDVFNGIATYNYLKDLPNHITIEVTALAASAASLIAMAGDELVMCTGSQLMMHEASTLTWGNKADHYKTINALEAIDNSIVSIYADKSGIDTEKIKNWLGEESWFTAEEAVENGLADRMKDATVKVNINSDEIVAKVIEHFNKVEPVMNKPKGLNKIFGGIK